MQISYIQETHILKKNLFRWFWPLKITYCFCQWSGRQDSNLRPPVPKTGALPGCATPRLNAVLNKQDTFGKTLFA